jgi:hypothetical protein
LSASSSITDARTSLGSSRRARRTKESCPAADRCCRRRTPSTMREPAWGERPGWRILRSPARTATGCCTEAGSRSTACETLCFPECRTRGRYRLTVTMRVVTRAAAEETRSRRAARRANGSNRRGSHPRCPKAGTPRGMVLIARAARRATAAASREPWDAKHPGDPSESEGDDQALFGGGSRAIVRRTRRVATTEAHGVDEHGEARRQMIVRSRLAPS